mmetsp:Transcript_11175/g.68897  ORF Transcript_11175/g.68897 Transcript_11175/m.68897 type:complete len:585 (-) Transcript_11175:3852-5606(-)
MERMKQEKRRKVRKKKRWSRKKKSLRSPTKETRKLKAERVTPSPSQSNEMANKQEEIEKMNMELVKELEKSQKELLAMKNVTEKLQEKEEIIRQVMEEGEALSKKQGAYEATIKKLRNTLKTNQKEKEDLAKKCAAEEARIESMRKDKEKTEAELSEVMSKSKAELAETKKYYEEMLAAEQKKNVDLSKEGTAHADALEKLKEAKAREDVLAAQVTELNSSLAQTSESANRREQSLRREIKEAEERAQQAEQRHEELASRMPESTRPLLRQIEAMQDQLNSQAESWTAIEVSLQNRASAADAKAAEAAVRLKATSEKLSQSHINETTLRAQLKNANAESTAAARTIEEYKGKVDALEAKLLDSEGHFKEAKEQMQRLVGELQEKQAEVEKVKAETETKVEQIALKVKELEAALQEKKDIIDRLENNGDRNIELRESLPLAAQEHEGAEETVYTPVPAWPATEEQHGESNRTFQLKTLLRMRTKELEAAEERCSNLERTRDVLAEELVLLTTAVDNAQRAQEHASLLQSDFEQLQRRHITALELMGEKEEMLEELLADLEDIKSLYRDHIELLIDQLVQAKSSSS